MKTSPDTLVEEVAEDFNTYLSKGVRVENVAQNIDPNLNIDDIEKALKIHFVLTKTEDDTVGVIDFVRGLRKELRQLKTSVTKNTEFFETEVRGRIDWQQTLKQRFRSASPDTGYACTQTQENYNIKENLVLKQVLSKIHSIVFDDLEDVLDRPDEYPWLEPWVGSDEVRSVVDEVYRDNIYLQRIQVEDDEQITDRTIESVKNSRNKLYRDAAQLLGRYRGLTRQDLDESEAKDLLRDTFIRPSENARLFELYWAFQLLNEFDDPQFKLIEEGSGGLIAEWEEGGYHYQMYHDSIDDLTFSEDVELDDAPDEDGYLRRLVRVETTFEETEREFFNRGSGDDLWGGRPDILVKKIDQSSESPELVHVFIGEVKYTQDQGYASQGLREVMEYVAMAKDSGIYIESEDGRIFESDNITGSVFVDNIKEIEPQEKENIGITIKGKTLPDLVSKI